MCCLLAEACLRLPHLEGRTPFVLRGQPTRAVTTPTVSLAAEAPDMSAIAKTKQLVSIRSESRTIYTVATHPALEPVVTNPVLLYQLNKYPRLM